MSLVSPPPLGAKPARPGCRHTRRLRLVGKARRGRDCIGSGSHSLHNLTVLAGVDAARALLSLPKELASATQLQIAARDSKTATKSTLLLHHLQASERLAPPLQLRMHDVSVRLKRTAPDTTAQLVELREPKQVLPRRDRSQRTSANALIRGPGIQIAIGTHRLLDDDGVSPRDVNATLDDGRGHQHVRLATAESGNA